MLNAQLLRKLAKIPPDARLRFKIDGKELNLFSFDFTSPDWEVVFNFKEKENTDASRMDVDRRQQGT